MTRFTFYRGVRVGNKNTATSQTNANDEQPISQQQSRKKPPSHLPQQLHRIPPAIDNPSSLHGVFQKERAPVLVQLRPHEVRRYSAGGGPAGRYPTFLSLEGATRHDAGVLCSTDLGADRHLNIERVSGRDVGCVTSSGARVRTAKELCRRLGLTFGLVPPAKPAFRDELPQSMTIGWLRSLIVARPCLLLS